MGKKPVLGKGISALIPEYAEPSGQGDASRQIVYINVDEIEPNPYQARTEFDEEGIDELMHSIQEKGVIQPITVNRIGQSYQIIAGERRWRATKKAGIQEIPAIIHEIESQLDLMELSLIENIQRENLTPIEEAEGYRSLTDKCFLTQEEVARKVGKNRSTVTNLLRLLQLPHEVQEFLRPRQLQMGHARALLGFEEGRRPARAGPPSGRGKMAVREVEKAVADQRTGRGKKKPPKEVHSDPHIRDYEERLQHRFGTADNIRRKAKKGGSRSHSTTMAI